MHGVFSDVNVVVSQNIWAHLCYIPSLLHACISIIISMPQPKQPLSSLPSFIRIRNAYIVYTICSTHIYRVLTSPFLSSIYWFRVTFILAISVFTSSHFSHSHSCLSFVIIFIILVFNAYLILCYLYCARHVLYCTIHACVYAHIWIG